MKSFVRGDTFAFKKKLKFADGSPVKANDVEMLLITFKSEPKDSSPIIFQKKLNDVIIDQDGYCHVVFKPKDTEKLVYGTYYFDIEVTLTNGLRKTSLEKIQLTEETTSHGGDE